MLETRKLTRHKYAQCHIEIEDNGTINFISYTTLVISAVPFEGYGYIYYTVLVHIANLQESRSAGS